MLFTLQNSKRIPIPNELRILIKVHVLDSKMALEIADQVFLVNKNPFFEITISRFCENLRRFLLAANAMILFL